jgi:hypothetical protein
MKSGSTRLIVDQKDVNLGINLLSNITLDTKIKQNLFVNKPSKQKILLYFPSDYNTVDETRVELRGKIG